MSNEGKKPGAPPDRKDEWEAAIEEWDATLGLPDPAAPVPTELSDDKTPIPGEDPIRVARPETSETVVSTGPAFLGHLPAPAEPLPLPPPLRSKGARPSSPPPLDDDPLKGLLDGDLDLPDAPGRALGSLLGDSGMAGRGGGLQPLQRSETPGDDWGERSDAATRMRTPLPDEGAPIVTTPSRAGGPPPSPDELSLPDEIAVEDGGEIESEELIEKTILADQMFQDAGDLEVVQESAITSSGRVVDITASPDRAAVPVSTGPAGRESGARVASREVAPEVLARLRSALDQLEEPGASAVKETPETDSDFYDDISIEKDMAEEAPDLDFSFELETAVGGAPAVAAAAKPTVSAGSEAPASRTSLTGAATPVLSAAATPNATATMARPTTHAVTRPTAPAATPSTAGMGGPAPSLGTAVARPQAGAPASSAVSSAPVDAPKVTPGKEVPASKSAGVLVDSAKSVTSAMGGGSTAPRNAAISTHVGESRVESASQFSAEAKTPTSLPSPVGSKTPVATPAVAKPALGGTPRSGAAPTAASARAAATATSAPLGRAAASTAQPAPAVARPASGTMSTAASSVSAGGAPATASATPSVGATPSSPARSAATPHVEKLPATAPAPAKPAVVPPGIGAAPTSKAPESSLDVLDFAVDLESALNQGSAAAPATPPKPATSPSGGAPAAAPGLSQSSSAPAETPTHKTPRPSPTPSVGAQDGDQDLFDLPVAPGDVEPGTDLFEMPAAEPPGASVAVAPPVVEARRLVDQPAPVPKVTDHISPPSLSVPETAAPGAVDLEGYAAQVALLDAERAMWSGNAGDITRLARLAYTAGRAAERGGDFDGARHRFEAALDADPSFTAALRGLRRVALAQRKLDDAADFLAREIELAGPRERLGLIALRADLLLVAGSWDAALAAYEVVVLDRPGDLRARSGMVDAAAANGDAPGLQVALAGLASGVRDSRLEAVLRTELARHDEAAGEDARAAEGYRAAVAVDGAALAPAMGLLRVALRGNSVDDLLAAQQRVAGSVNGGFQAALMRRIALLQLGAGRPAEAADALATVEDVPSLSLRALAEEGAGRGAAAAATLEQLASLETETGRRVEALLRLGELHERLGGYTDAAHAFDRAAAAAPEDLRAARAVERVSRSRGDLERLVVVARTEAARDPELADRAHVRAARLLMELDRPAEAVAAFEAALATNPRHGSAVTDLVELHLRGGRIVEAAQVLARAADAEEDAEIAMLHRERAARLYARSGDVNATLAVVRTLREGNLALPAAWLEQRVLATLAPETAAAPEASRLFADSLAAEAEATTDQARAASLWQQRGVALEAIEPEAAVESHRQSLALLPAHPAALLALELRSARAGDVAEVIALEQGRIVAAEGRPEAVAARLRLGGLYDQSGDAAVAVQTYLELLGQLPPGGPVAAAVEELLADAARRTGDHTRAAEIDARIMDREGLPDGPYKAGLALHLAELHELRLGNIEIAAELYARALALRPGSLVRPGLVRTYKALGRFAELATMARAELENTTDASRLVSAHEQLSQLDLSRGDIAGAQQNLNEILALDHSHHAAFRSLERDFIREERWADLISIYEQMGLTATDSPFARAVYLDLARLRERLGGTDLGALQNDYRMALYRDARCRPALRRVLNAAREQRDYGQIAELCGRLAETEASPRSAAVFSTRAGEALETVASNDAALARYRFAAESARHLPALRAMAKLAVSQLAYSDAVWASEAGGEALHDPAERARAHLCAGLLAQEKLHDVRQALASFRAVLAAEPSNLDAFLRLRSLLEGEEDWAALAQALSARIDVESEPARLVPLHLDLAALYRDRLGNRDLAKQHLRKVLAHDAGHHDALLALSSLYYDDQQWPEAAEVLIRRARIEKDPATLKDIFFKLGLIYDERTPDTKRAVVSFTRVLQYDPENKVALEHLSNLHMKEMEWKGALVATSRLAELESDLVRKVEHLHRVAKIHEEGFKDARAAHDAFRRAVDVDPSYLPAIGELVRFYERSGDLTSARVHLDRSVQGTRAQLDRNADDAEGYHALFRIFNWRRSFDQALIVASLLKSMNQLNAEEQTLLQRFGAKDGYPGSALGDPTLDELLFVSAIPPGFRHLFRLLDDSLQKAFRSDVRRLGVGKHEKLPRLGHAVRDIANRIAADLGVRNFDLYITTAQPKILTVELTDPVSIVVGSQLASGVHEHELMFYLGRCLKMIQSHMAVPLRLSGDELGVLLGGIVRQFVPDFVPRGFDEGAVAAESVQLGRAIPKKLHQEILPFALECADPSLDLRALSVALIHTANRAGTLCAGSVPAALSAVRRLGDEAQVKELLRFAVSDELAELRRAVGVAVG